MTARPLALLVHEGSAIPSHFIAGALVLSPSNNALAGVDRAGGAAPVANDKGFGHLVFVLWKHMGFTTTHLLDLRDFPTQPFSRPTTNT